MDLVRKIAIMDKLRYKYPKLYLAIRTIYDLVQHLATIKYYILRIFPIDKNKIIFDTYGGGDFSDNPKYIALEFLNRNKNYKLIWLLSKNIVNSQIPDKIQAVKYNSISKLYHIVTAKVWITNIHMLSDVRKRRKQYYIQTWHGFGPKGQPNTTFSNSQLRSEISDSKRTDLYLSCCPLSTKVFRDYFHYNGEVLEEGFPRYDLFVNGNYLEIHNKVCSILKIPPYKKILLYAPTVRSTYNQDAMQLPVSEVLISLSKKFGGEWVVLNRLHHAIANQPIEMKMDSPSLFDASNYVDIQELIYISDVLITDYSSCMFDFAVTRKPCFLYCSDYDEYEKTTGFCISPKELPFPIAQSNIELQMLINSFDINTYKEKLDLYLSNIGFKTSGNSSKAIVDWILLKINSEDNSVMKKS